MESFYLQGLWAEFGKGAFITGILSLLCWFAFKKLVKTERAVPVLWKVRMVGLFGVVGFWGGMIRPLGEKGGVDGVIALGTTVILGVMMVVLWLPVVMNFSLEPLMRLVQGEDAEAPSKAFYAGVHGWRKKGDTEAALKELEKQLDMFPKDFEGLVLKLEIITNDLCDFDEGRSLLDSLMSDEDISTEERASVANRYAGWAIKVGLDPEEAAYALDQVIERFPDTEFAEKAKERKGRLPNKEFLVRNALAMKKK